MKEKVRKIISTTAILLLAFAFVIKFAGPPTLRLYVETGIGNCQKLPILCMAPETEVINLEINEEYIKGLQLYKLPGIELRMPKAFTVVKDFTRVHYKKRPHRKDNSPITYLLYERKDFFVNLFPQVRKQAVKDDYEFFNRIMSSQTKNINNLTDTFFTIMKVIFIPDLGDQKNIKMLKFTSAGKRGFINYSLSAGGNYFDCNIFNHQGDFFKIYIKDTDGILDLDRVLAIISTVKKE